MQTPQDYIRQERQRSKYFQKFGNIDQEKLQEYLKRLPTEKEREEAQKVWNDRNPLTLSEIWERQTVEYKEHLVLGIKRNTKLESVVNETYIGVLPTGEVDAFAKYAENGERMIILNQGLLHTIHYWSSLFLRTVDEGGDNFFWNDKKIRNDCLKWIYHVWNNKLTPSLVVPDIFPKTSDGWQLSQALTFSSIVFVMAHEFGHVLHNHRGYSKKRSVNHQMEFDADKIGMQTSFFYSIIRGGIVFPNDSFYTKLMLLGPYLALNILALFGISDSHTHPSIIHRIEKIHNGYEAYALESLGYENYTVFKDYLAEDDFNKMKDIANQMLVRHLLYRDELNRLKSSWK